MNLKKCLPLLGVLACSLTGCKQNKFNYDPDNFLPNGTPENPYQIVTNPVTIEIFAPHSSGQPEFKDLVMFKKLSQLTNLNFTFTTPDTSAYSTRRGTVFNDKNYYPDLFLYSNPLNEQIQYAERKQNIFVPLNATSYVDANNMDIGNLIDQYMPTYKSLLDSNFGIDRSVEDAKATCTVSDGKMYAAVSAKDVGRDLTYKLYINNAWIKRVYSRYSDSYCKIHEIDDASKISTIDDYIGVLTDFKNKDANGDGSNTDEVPVSSCGMEYLRNHLMAAFGIVTPYIEINDEHTHYTFNALTDQYREYLKVANTMYKNKIMDSGTYSNKSTNEIAAYGIKGQVGSFVAAAPYLVTGKELDKHLKDENGEFYRLDKEFTTVQPLISDSNSVRRQWGFGYFQSTGACINAKSHYAREIARLLDIMYTDVGVQLLAYGIEGENWDWDLRADGSKGDGSQETDTWTFNVPNDWSGDQEQYRATITPNVGSGAGLYWSNKFVGKMNDDVITDLNRQSEVYRPFLKVPEPQNYHFNYDEVKKLTLIQSSLNLKLLPLECEMVKGTNGSDPFNDADWTKFKNDILSFSKYVDGTKYEDLYNNMLSRYLNK